jgi:hypothetical protein
MSKVYLTQDIPIIKYHEDPEKIGTPKFDITPALKYGEIKVMHPRLAQMQFSPGPLIFEIRNSLKEFTSDDYLLLYGDPALIGVVCSVVSDITNGKYKILKWDRRQETYYPIELNIFQK